MRDDELLNYVSGRDLSKDALKNGSLNLPSVIINGF